MIWRMLFLVSVLKGVDAYKKPYFWASIYVLFLFTMSYMFELAANTNLLLPVVGLMALNFIVSAVFFHLLCALDGILWLLTMGIGVFILSVMP